jgi:dynein heavy chain
MVICMSPIGDQMRKRVAKFPGVVNCCQVDFFHAWPREACEKVAYNFLKEIEFETDDIRRGVGNFMSEIHLSIDKYNLIYKEKFKRQCYTTPKSFLELIEFYLKILGEKREKFGADKDMYTQGYEKMDNIGENVAALNEQIKVRKQEADIIAMETKKLLDKVTVESEKAAIIATSAAETAEKAGIVLAEASAVREEAEAKFAEAEPALEAANKAANNMEVADINEFKAYKACPEKAVDVCIGINWVIMPVGQKSKFGDWK